MRYWDASAPVLVIEVRTGAHGERGSSAEARDTGAFLAFDEAAPPLSDRRFVQTIGFPP